MQLLIVHEDAEVAEQLMSMARTTPRTSAIWSKATQPRSDVRCFELVPKSFRATFAIVPRSARSTRTFRCVARPFFLLHPDALF